MRSVFRTAPNSAATGQARDVGGIVQKIDHARGEDRCPPPPRAPSSQRSRRVLAAVHAQPRVQEAAAADLANRRTCIITRPRGARFSTRPRRCGAATPATTGPPIVAAIQRQAAELDFSPTFQFAHPLAFQLSSRIAELAPGDLDHVFFTNSGSEAADTALKIALAYHNVRGHGSRQRLIGRERGYHGVGFGGISVGGMVNNRKFFGSLLAGTDHLPATYSREHQAFTKGEPEWGGHLADALEGIVGLHDASTIAAVIVEPMAGSTGVLPAPKGYLQKLRAICDKYGILLIFDEVITGFGRLGFAFAAERYGVIPDMITFAKGVTSGTVPMGGVIVRKPIYDAFMNGPEHAIELFHGYTYSGHPLACAAGLATLDLYRDEKLFERVESAGAEMVRRADDAEGPAERRRHPLRRPHRRDRSRADRRQPGPARLSGARIFVPRGRHHAAPLRRHDRTDAAVHHQRGADRRDRRQGGADDQGGGVRGDTLRTEGPGQQREGSVMIYDFAEASRHK